MHEFIGSSPLSFTGGGIQQQQQPQQQPYRHATAPTIDPLPETNAERNYRDAANFCEVAAPAALGSAVVFAFHSMQVAGGSVFAIGLYQIYLAANITGQSGNRWTSAIVGLGVTGGMIASLSEPISESQQASEAKARITTGIKEIRTAGKPHPTLYLNYLPPIALSIIFFCLFLKLKGGRKP
ncbi:hypothetical protein QT970_14875 [Microcoleus sp. herbarium8]|uniref:hypothetical protein n=1 Tax=Microcoleus sp. herbarium8 TaxID=3055436 RepID=UPI002FD11557